MAPRGARYDWRRVHAQAARPASCFLFLQRLTDCHCRDDQVNNDNDGFGPPLLVLLLLREAPSVAIAVRLRAAACLVAVRPIVAGPGS